MSKYAKFYTALAGAAVLIAGELLGVTSAWYSVIVSIVTALGVYQVKNEV